MRISSRVSFVVGVLLFGTTAMAATSDKSVPSSSDVKRADVKSALSSGDVKFVKQAAQGGMMEVELGKIAADKATSAQVKDFARRMVDDHSKANTELMSLAKSKNVELATALEGKHKSTVDRLSKVEADKFDRQYMNLMVSDHKDDIKSFENAANKAKDADVKSFAAKNLPTLKTHLQLAQETDKSLKAAKK